MKSRVIVPKNCPICDSLLEVVKDQIFCRNTECEAVSHKKITHFAKTMKIKGLGEKTISKLDLESILDIYELSKEEYTSILGEKIGVKVYNEIEKSKVTSLATLLSSFSIYLIGKTAGIKIEKIASSLDDISADTCKIAGLGEKATKSLLVWLNENKDLYSRLPITISSKQQKQETSIIACISGKLQEYPTKSAAEEYLSNNGIELVANLTKKVDYLISEDGKESSKVKKANSYNIKIVTINELIKEIKNK